MVAAVRVSGLEKRLQSDTLTTREKERYELARQIRTLQGQGKTLHQVARTIGVSSALVEQFVRRGVYKTYCAHLDKLAVGEDQLAIDKVVHNAKQEFASFAPDALAYYRTCFIRNPIEDRADKGEFKDDDKAMWATEKVSKGLGLTEPEHAVRPIINISVGHIHAEMKRVAADDAEAEAASRTIDITPTNAEA